MNIMVLVPSGGYYDIKLPLMDSYFVPIFWVKFLFFGVWNSYFPIFLTIPITWRPDLMHLCIRVSPFSPIYAYCLWTTRFVTSVFFLSFIVWITSPATLWKRDFIIKKKPTSNSRLNMSHTANLPPWTHCRVSSQVSWQKFIEIYKFNWLSSIFYLFLTPHFENLASAM